MKITEQVSLLLLRRAKSVYLTKGELIIQPVLIIRRLYRKWQCFERDLE